MRTFNRIGAALLLFFVSCTAHAAQITPTLKSGYFVTSLGINFNGVNSTSAAGTFNIAMTGGPAGYPTSFEAYCVDLAHQLSGLSYSVNLLPQSSLLNGGKVAWLYHHYGTNDFGTKVVDSTSAAALQAAIWDAEYDNGDGFASGTFKLQTLSGSIYTAANSYLAAAAGKSDTATYLQATSHTNNQNQDMIGPVGAAVPEPGTVAFLGSGGAAFVAFMVRRRKK